MTHKKIFIEERDGFLKIAVTEGPHLSELFIEEEKSRSRIGNIYKGKVVSTLPGLNSVFLDGGKENFFLPLEENEKASKGDILLVQLQKEKRDKKAALVTLQISLPGRYLVYTPLAKKSGVSHKIEDASERKRLKSIMDDLQKEETSFLKRLFGATPQEGAFIIRTEAMGRDLKELQRDRKNLLHLWKLIKKREEHVREGLVFELENAVLKTVREKFTSEVTELLVNKREIYGLILQYVRTFFPELADRVKLDREKNLFRKYDLEKEITKILSPKVDIPSGGYIVIQQTEALTSVDVNSGKMIKGSPEENAYLVNKEAAHELMHQIRLRNIAGIIIVDFIEMKSREKKNSIFKIIKEEAEKDKAKINILPLTSLGLLEMTRQRLREDILSKITVHCAYCHGKGYLPKKGI